MQTWWRQRFYSAASVKADCWCIPIHKSAGERNKGPK